MNKRGVKKGVRQLRLNFFEKYCQCTDNIAFLTCVPPKLISFQWINTNMNIWMNGWLAFLETTQNAAREPWMLSESERGEEKEADTGGRKQEEESNMHLHGVPVSNWKLGKHEWIGHRAWLLNFLLASSFFSFQGSPNPSRICGPALINCSRYPSNHFHC